MRTARPRRRRWTRRGARATNSMNGSASLYGSTPPPPPPRRRRRRRRRPPPRRPPPPARTALRPAPRPAPVRSGRLLPRPAASAGAACAAPSAGAAFAGRSAVACVGGALGRGRRGGSRGAVAFVARLLGVAHRAAAERPAHRRALHEHPADVRHRLAADEATLVEQPPYCPWNSWKESFDSTTASARSAICSTNASPRPITPAGGEITSPAATRLLERGALGLVDAVREARVDDDGDGLRAELVEVARALLRRAVASSASVRPSVARFEPSTTTWLTVIRGCKSTRACHASRGWCNRSRTRRATTRTLRVVGSPR